MTEPALARIEAGEKTLATVFSDAYAFSIPPYQRPYAWDVEQASELLDDLITAMKPEGGADGLYFLGSIVLVKSPNGTDAKVVDGQQRLTTFTILFSVLRDLTSDQEKLYKRESYIKQAADTDKGIDERLRLLLRKQDQPFFEKTIQNRGATNDLPPTGGLDDSQVRIVENAAYFRRELEGMDEDDRNQLISFILRNCFLVVVEVPTDRAARRIFTVLNARGLDLSAADILKAGLLEHAGARKEEMLASRWEEIELALGRSKFVDLFVQIRMIYQREKPRTSLEEGFPQYVTPFREQPLTFIDDVLEPYSDALLLVDDKSDLEERLGAKSVRLIRSLERLDNKDWLAPLIEMFKQLSEGTVDGDYATDFLFKLERLAYYLFVTRADINTRIYRYTDVLEELDPKRGKTRGTGGTELSDEEVNRFLEALDGDIYSKTRVVKPLLLRLDQALSDGTATYELPIISVEHVCPQTIKTESEWESWFPDEKVHQKWLHRLANLALLSKRKNSSASNWELEVKKTKYFTENETTPFVLTAQLLAVDEWTPEALQARQASLLKQFIKEWDLGENAYNVYRKWKLIG
ncbi:DUF262 domain-containing protein [Parvularcula flava]|uniref:DUF262 domain-containing protein n=1 Tax=Aquisalinus luteolus TaxID=1566827 RepID=A0A8J3AAR3_9PROT|nr:DUF262 domain-containing protein [Aquisalinus luteolus]NHK29670.1 DUF262 domain-containing protein [Aquisalinus luteolus]GGI02156.1 hypothetical protein GCM10011355_34490 [Aquisalinus luteolus]